MIRFRRGLICRNTRPLSQLSALPDRVRIMPGRCMLKVPQAAGLARDEPIISAAGVVAGGYEMRLGVVVLLISLCCADCARFQQPAAEQAAPQQAAAPDKPAPVADAAPAGFTCSDGTISRSQDACLIDMARARLPSTAMERTPINPAHSTTDPPTGSVR
jgi:hypothetical protein